MGIAFNETSVQKVKTPFVCMKGVFIISIKVEIKKPIELATALGDAFRHKLA